MRQSDIETEKALYNEKAFNEEVPQADESEQPDIEEEVAINVSHRNSNNSLD